MEIRNKILMCMALFGILFLVGSASAAVDFPADDAGISVYVKAKTSIDLNNVKPALATIERETGDYIIGTVAMDGHSEVQRPHVYVSTDGWVVAYYPRDRSSGWLLRYPKGGPIPTTTLHNAVQIVCDEIGGTTTGIKYYDFRHPDATNMMIIGESTGGSSWFKVTIPTDFTVYRVDWSNYGYADLDGVRFSSVSSWAYGSFNPSGEFQNGIVHTLDVTNYKGTGRLALVIEYAE